MNLLTNCARASGAKTAKARELPSDTITGIPKLRAAGFRTAADGPLYAVKPPKTTACEITFIPYFAWANRGISQMRCFLPEKG